VLHVPLLRCGSGSTSTKAGKLHKPLFGQRGRKVQQQSVATGAGSYLKRCILIYFFYNCLAASNIKPLAACR
jgi:hypothetical protein